MKNKKSFIGFSIVGFVLFFITISATSILSVLIFNAVNVNSNGNIFYIILALFGSVLFATLFCVVADLIRRKKMIENPVEKIMEATDRIAKGDFRVKLITPHSGSYFDEFDKIMENINAMAEELSKNEMLKNDFIANVSHEIKTPLAIIQNYAQILKSNKTDEKTKKLYLEKLAATVTKLSELVSNILKLNKLENRKLMPEITKFNLGESVRRCVIDFEEKAEKKNLILECDIDDVEISSSKEYLEMVWNNLISNAIKFTDFGTVSVSLKEVDGLAVVEVTDTGCGISKETGNRIFDKFYQGETSHSGEGNGLGLALVKKIIDVLGGEISIKSKLGKGSTFTVTVGNVSI